MMPPDLLLVQYADMKVLLLVEYEGMIKNSGLKERFLNLTSVGAYSTAYDIIFIEELKSYFDNGLIKGLEYLCGSCCNQLKSKRGNLKSTVTDNAVYGDIEGSSSQVGSDPPCDAVSDDGEVNYGSLIPKLCLFNGLFYWINSC